MTTSLSRLTGAALLSALLLGACSSGPDIASSEPSPNASSSPTSAVEQTTTLPPSTTTSTTIDPDLEKRDPLSRNLAMQLAESDFEFSPTEQQCITERLNTNFTSAELQELVDAGDRNIVPGDPTVPLAIRVYEEMVECQGAQSILAVILERDREPEKYDCALTSTPNAEDQKDLAVAVLAQVIIGDDAIPDRLTPVYDNFASACVGQSTSPGPTSATR